MKKETKDHVIKTVFDQLLHCENCEIKVGHDGRSWKKGGKLPIGEVAALFDREMLQELKSECGGLQTLLRNSSHVYQGKPNAKLLYSHEFSYKLDCNGYKYQLLILERKWFNKILL